MGKIAILLLVNNESIVLIGMAGVGKSTVGLALARSLGFSFTDLDEYIQKNARKTIQNIVDTEGEKALLQLEEKSMYEIDLRRRVIAPGGSIIYITGLMDYLKQHTLIVYLNETFENLERRLKNAPTRGIVGLKSKSLREIYDERSPLYASYAGITIDSNGKAPNQVVEEIFRQYR